VTLAEAIGVLATSAAAVGEDAPKPQSTAVKSTPSRKKPLRKAVLCICPVLV
jgi:hypothetical protein